MLYLQVHVYYTRTIWYTYTMVLEYHGTKWYVHVYHKWDKWYVHVYKHYLKKHSGATATQLQWWALSA